MDAGREMDAEVASKVMRIAPGTTWGEWPQHDWDYSDSEYNHFYCRRCMAITDDWTTNNTTPDQAKTLFPGPCIRNPLAYSTDIAAAWQVVEHLWNQPPPHDWYFTLSNFGGWEADFHQIESGTRATSKGSSAAHAICLAALAAAEAARQVPV